MGGNINDLIVALTGQLPFVLLAAVPLAFVISLILLWIYLGAVKRSMRHHPTKNAAPHSTEEPRPRSVTGPPAVALDVGSKAISPAPNPDAEKLAARAAIGPWRAAVVYGIAGIFFSVVMASVYLVAHTLC